MKISDLLDFYSTNSLGWEQLDYENGVIRNLHYGLIHVGLPTLVDVASERLPYIKASEMPKNFTLVKSGDVAFADASEDTEEVAKTVEFTNLDNMEVVCGLHTIHGRDKGDRTAIGFKGYAFASPAFHNQIRRIAQGTKIYSISTKNFTETYISIPSKDEQSKIARLFRALDERIAAQNKIIEDLKSFKSALIDKIYSSIEGIQYTYRELLKVVNERNKSLQYINVLSASQQLGMVERDDLNIDIKYEASDINTYKIVREGDYVMHLRSFQGGLAFSEKIGVCSPAYTILRPNEKLIFGYLAEYFMSKTFINSLRLVTYGIRDGRSINVDEWLDMTVTIPSLPVQQKTLNILDSIKSKIRNEEAILGMLQQQKQFLLNELFI